jgi:nucleotide-sensitive chloride channel 1A
VSSPTFSMLCAQANEYRNLIVFSTSRGKGISIKYPQIALHALGDHNSTLLQPPGPAVLLQVNLHDEATSNSMDDISTLDFTLVPSSAPNQESSPAKDMFEALSACADLHPDPASPNSQDELEPEPGAGGWITAENMADFVDENGNFVANLGAGAGTVRQRDDEAANGTDDDADDDTKWRRTE